MHEPVVDELDNEGVKDCEVADVAEVAFEHEKSIGCDKEEEEDEN